MKWLALIGILTLAGCRDGILDPTPQTGHAGSQVQKTPSSPNHKSFAMPPQELKTVLAELRRQTGWKLTCDPELDKELVYLKFTDKTEQDIAMALGQVLLANFPTKDGAITLSVSHAAMINQISFQNEVYLGRIKPKIDSLATASQAMAFAPGDALERLVADIKLLPSLATSTEPEDRMRRDMISPGGRAAAAFLNLVTENEFAHLQMGKPLQWSTSPTGSQQALNPAMESVVDQLVQESVEWNGAFAAAQSRGLVKDEFPTPQRFSPRDDIEFSLERGNPELDDTTSFTVVVTALARSGARVPVARLSVPMDVTPQPADPVDPSFEAAILKRIPTPHFADSESKTAQGGGTDVRLELLQLTIDNSAKNAENIVANLGSDILPQMVRLSMTNRIAPGQINADQIMVAHHAKFKMPHFVFYRPHFIGYARLDRDYWTSRGSGVTNSPWSRQAASDGSGIIK